MSDRQSGVYVDKLGMHNVDTLSRDVFVACSSQRGMVRKDFGGKPVQGESVRGGAKALLECIEKSPVQRGVQD